MGELGEGSEAASSTSSKPPPRPCRQGQRALSRPVSGTKWLWGSCLTSLSLSIEGRYQSRSVGMGQPWGDTSVSDHWNLLSLTSGWGPTQPTSPAEPGLSSPAQPADRPQHKDCSWYKRGNLSPGT